MGKIAFAVMIFFSSMAAVTFAAKRALLPTRGKD
jgi:hypothetical protein